MKSGKKRVHFKLTAYHSELVEAMRGNWSAAAFITDALDKLLVWFERHPAEKPPVYGRLAVGGELKHKELQLSAVMIGRIEAVSARLGGKDEKPTMTQFVALALDRAKDAA